MREKHSRGGRPSVDELIAGMSRDRRTVLERSGGLTADRLRRMAATPQGARTVRALATERPAPAGRLFDDRALDSLLDRLTEDNRAALAARGLDLDVLRSLCSTEPGTRLVWELLQAPPPDDPDGPPDRLPNGSGGRGALGGWLLVEAVAFAGVAATVGIDVLIGRVALLFGLAYLLFVLFLVMARVRRTPGYGAATGLVAAAFLVLMVVGVFEAPAWYLAVRGTQARATLAAPAHQWTHGARVAYCRVRLPGGAVRQVAVNAGDCATAAGRPTRVVYDPAGWFAPRLGTAAQLDAPVSGGVAGGAAAVLLLAPLAALARRRGTRPPVKRERKDQ